MSDGAIARSSRAACALLLWGVVLTSAGLTRTATAATTDDRPNIVLIVAEDLSPRIGAFGDALAHTPSLDQLAREGVRFTRLFTTSGVCAPSRSALITGMHAPSIGTQHMRTSSFGDEASGPLGTFSAGGFAYEAVPPPTVKAFPEHLRAAGYFTANNAKTDYQFGEPTSIWDRSGPDTDWRERAPDQPFFLMVSLMQTHESRMFRPGWAGATAGQAAWAETLAGRLDGLPARTDPAAVNVPGYLPDTAEIRRDLAQHYDGIRRMDAAVGEWLARLDAEGLAETTIVLWTTDHGDGLPRAKRSLYDSGLHVPLVIRFPDRTRAGAEDSRLLSFVDLAPTILGLAGVAVPDIMQGSDFLATPDVVNEQVFAARDRIDELPDHSRAVRDDRYKLIRNRDPNRPLLGPVYYRENLATMQELRRLDREGVLDPVRSRWLNGPRPPLELYDLLEDPNEMMNVAEDPRHAETLDRLSAALDRHLATTGDLGNLDEREMVESLMWPGGEQPMTAPPTIAVTPTIAVGTRAPVGAGSAIPEAGATGAWVVRLTTSSPGASLEYRLNGDAWRLYVTELTVATDTRLEARAVRYGYRPSAITTRALDPSE